MDTSSPELPLTGAEIFPDVGGAPAVAVRTHSRRPCGGLGLEKIRNLVDLHGSEVEANGSGTGRSAEYRVHPPVKPEPAAFTAPATMPQPASRRLRVAIIEDNRDSADSLSLLLQVIGHEVRAAHTGPAGVELVSQWRPDAVISDIGLPGFDGYEVARRIRAEPGVEKVLLVALTGYGDDSFRRKSEEAGFDHHLVKPADPLVLQRLLAERATQLGPPEGQGASPKGPDA